MKPIHNVLTGRVAATVCAMLGVGFCATPALATTCVDNVRLLDGFTDQIGAICFDATGILSVGGSVAAYSLGRYRTISPHSEVTSLPDRVA